MTEPHERRVAERYTNMAGDYAAFWAPRLRRAARPLLERLPVAEAARVLDLGCGVGSFLDDLQGLVPSARIIGADLTEAMLQRAPGRFARVLTDASRPGLAGASVDVVVAAYMLQHLPEPSHGLAAAAALLRPGGALGVITWGPSASFAAERIWNEELDARGADADESDLSCRHLLDSSTKMRALAIGVGLADVECFEGSFDARFTAAGFLELRSTVGRARRRFESLDDAGRASCLRCVGERIAELPAEELVDRTPLVYTIARRPRAVTAPTARRS